MAATVTRTATGGVGSSGGVVNTGSISIGTAAADRYVVLCVTSETANASQTSATIDFGSGDTAMIACPQATLAGSSVFARQFYLLVPTGTTATFKITYNAAVTSSQNQHSVYSVTGNVMPGSGGTASSTDMDSSTPITTHVLSIPANGACVAVASCSVGSTAAKTWSNLTEDQELSVGSNYTHTTATSTSVLTANVIRLTGGTNAEDGALSWLLFVPNAPAFGDVLGSAGFYSTSWADPTTSPGFLSVRVGDLIFVSWKESNNNGIVGISDNLGNTYTALATDNGVITSNFLDGFYSIVTVAGNAIPVADLTGAGTGSAALLCTAYSGPFAVSPLDKNVAAVADAVEPYTCTTSGTLTQADNLIVGYFGSSATELYVTPGPSARLDTYINSGIAGGGGLIVGNGPSCITSLVVSATTAVAMSIEGNNGARNTICIAAVFMKGSPNKIITVDSGSYSITGTAATLKHGWKTAPDIGAYAFTGSNATLRKNYPLVAGVGTYSVSGQTASLLHKWILTAGAGAYSFTGTVATLIRNLPLVAGVGAYNFTGTAANLVNSHHLVAGAGSYSFTGTAATLTHALKIIAAAGAYNFSGTTVNLIHGGLSRPNVAFARIGAVGEFPIGQQARIKVITTGIRLSAGAGSYSISGMAASLLHKWMLTAGAGAYNFTGTAANLFHGWKLTAGAGAYNFTGTDVTLTIRSDKFLVAGAGSYNFTGTAASLLHKWILTAGAGAYNVTGTAASLVYGKKVIAGAGAYNFTGTAASLLHKWILTAGSGAYNFTGTAATLVNSHHIAAGAGAYNFTGTAASLLHKWILTAGAGAYNFTGTAVTLTIRSDKFLGAGGGAYNFTGTAASLLHKWRLTAGAGAYNFTGTAASLVSGKRLTAGAGAYNVTGQAAFFVQLRRLIAGQGIYLISGQNSTLAVGRKVQGGVGSYNILGTAASFVHNWSIQAGVGTYLISGFDADLIYNPLHPPRKPTLGKGRIPDAIYASRSNEASQPRHGVEASKRPATQASKRPTSFGGKRPPAK